MVCGTLAVLSGACCSTAHMLHGLFKINHVEISSIMPHDHHRCRGACKKKRGNACMRQDSWGGEVTEKVR